MKRNRATAARLAALAAMTGSLSLGAGCGKKSSNSDTPPATTAATGTTSTSSSTTTSTTNATANSTITLLNTLASAVPSNLALTAFSTDTSSGSLVDLDLNLINVDEDGFALADEDASKQSGKSPVAELKEKQQILAGKSDSCLAAGYAKPPAPPKDETCYEFDSDMVQVSSVQNGQTKVLGTKNGKNSNGEACLVAFARSQIVKVKDPLDRSQNILNAALCQANKDAKAAAVAAGKDDSTVDLMPANVGDSIDLAPALKNAFSKGGRTKEVVTSIKMTRLADVGGQKVYQTVFNLTDDQSNTRAFTLNHSPKDKTNEEYNGTLYFAVKPPKGKADPMAGPNGTADFTFYVSIGYVRSKNTDGTFTTAYEARAARFSNDIDPITSTGLLDYNTNADFKVASTDSNYGMYKKADGSYYQQANQAANGFNYISVSNTEDKDGKLTAQKISYWMNPGSNYSENARGMVFSAAPNATTGVMEGCANSGSASVDMGSGISIRRYLNEGSTNSAITLQPRGLYHPFINTEVGPAGGGGGPGVAPTTNGTGTYKYSKSQNNGQLTMQWAVLQATGTDAVSFVEKQVTALMTSQCFKQNSTSGLWEIDTAKTTGVDGFDVVKTTDTVKVLTPPPPPKPALQDGGAGKIDFKPKAGTPAGALDD